MAGTLRDLVMPGGGPKAPEAKAVRIRPGTRVVWFERADRSKWSRGEIVRDDGDRYLVDTVHGEIMMPDSEYELEVDDFEETAKGLDLPTLEDLDDRLSPNGWC